jgi:hypothetical protein
MVVPVSGLITAPFASGFSHLECVLPVVAQLPCFPRDDEVRRTRVERFPSLAAHRTEFVQRRFQALVHGMAVLQLHFAVFGGDAEVGAIRAAIYEEHAFHLTFPDGTSKTVKLGPDANCYNQSLSIGPKRAVQHLIAVSADLRANGSAGVTYLLHLDGETKDLAWATLVSLLGIPADPRWGDTVLGGMRRDERIRRLDGIGCNPATILGTRQDMMDRIRRWACSSSPT